MRQDSVVLLFIAIILGFVSQNQISEKRYFLTHYVKSKPHNKIIHEGNETGKPFPIGSRRDLSLNTSLLGEQKYEITAELKMVLPYSYSTTVEINSLRRILLRICTKEHAELKQNKNCTQFGLPVVIFMMVQSYQIAKPCFFHHTSAIGSLGRS